MEAINSPAKTKLTKVECNGVTVEFPFPIYVDKKEFYKHVDQASQLLFLINEITEEFKRRDDDPEMDYFVW